MKSHLLALALFLAGPAWAEDPATMTLTGRGEVAATPDMATLSLGVVTQGQSAAAALGQNSGQLTRVFEALAAAGVAAEDMQTTRFSIDPLWSGRGHDSGDPAEIAGYAVTNSLSIAVRDLDRLGAVLDAVTGAGANEFGGLRFGLAEPGPVEEEARRAAVADAQARAALYADAAGVEILGIRSIAEGGGGGAPAPRSERMAVAAMPVPVAEGQVNVSAQVSITYEIGQ
ncbi:DUF541 domain-containing protein [Rhodobacteraceae bacterium W635]|uniref:SIMPL domain-containing protein n=1 Tax=Nioella halotolerans TaxID=2303578 RepID=UPI000E3D952A|nr:DUF541 domain-containing protein [Rhodobacteraceae bacterium W635]